MKITAEEAKEYKKCAQSVVYTASKYVRIKTMEGSQLWKPYPGAPEPFWQQTLLETLEQRKDVILLKSRQVGASWTIAIYVAWLIHFTPNIEILLLSVKEEKAIKLLGKVKFICRNFPDFIRRESNKDTQTVFSVIHKQRGGEVISESRVDSLTTTGGSGRGDTARFVFIDEFAWLDSAEDTWKAVKPTTSHGGQIALASSPNGNTGPFARIWKQADSGDSEFIPVRVHYTDCGFDKKWLAKAADGMTDEDIAQEYELAMVGVGAQVFSASSLTDCYFPNGLPEELQRLADKSKKFATGVDNAEITRFRSSIQRDFNAITSLNEYGIQVAAVQNKMPIEEWAGMTEDIGNERVEIMGYVSKWHRKFPGLMFIEENGAGLTVGNRYIAPDDNESEMALRRTTTKSKPRLVNQFAIALASQQVIITDKTTYYQLLVYEDLGGGKFSAPKGEHDDAVMAILEAYDALIEMGGYEFDAEAITGGSLQKVVSPLDPEFAPGVNTLPSVDEYVPAMIIGHDMSQFWDLEPGGKSIEQLKATIG